MRPLNPEEIAGIIFCVTVAIPTIVNFVVTEKRKAS